MDGSALLRLVSDGALHEAAHLEALSQHEVPRSVIALHEVAMSERAAGSLAEVRAEIADLGHRGRVFVYALRSASSRFHVRPIRE